MYTIYICDDDALFASSLRAKVQQLFPGSFQISVFHSIRTLQAAAEKTPPNIALLDIQLGQDNGISLAKQFFPSPSQTQVIFITGYIEYCSDVYETEHIYFLLKPLDPVLLKKSLQKAVDRLEALPITLSIQTREGAFSLPLTDILYIESHMRKLSIHTPKNTYVVSGSLSSLPQEIQQKMVQCHKSFLVNPRHVQAILTPSNSFNKFFQLSSGESIPISQSQWRASRSVFLDLITQQTKEVPSL